MQTGNLIPVNQFCIHHNIELSFIYSLQESGLIEISKEEENIFIPEDQLPHLEKLVRLYYELDINIEGIETITYLLQRMNSMNTEINLLRNRLRLYESE